MERGYIWLWPEFSRVNLTRPVSLVSSSPRNRINREPLLRQRFFLSLSLFLPSLLSFFLSHGSLKKYPRIISFRTRYLPLMLGSPSHPPTLLPFKPRSNEQFSRGWTTNERRIISSPPILPNFENIVEEEKNDDRSNLGKFLLSKIDSPSFFSRRYTRKLHRHPSGKTLNYLLWRAGEVSRGSS